MVGRLLSLWTVDSNGAVRRSMPVSIVDRMKGIAAQRCNLWSDQV